MEASFGNGYLDRAEHRQQYKLNGLRGSISGGITLRCSAGAIMGFPMCPG
jgi:hypothetical protein